MITGIESHAHADGTFELRVTSDDGDFVMSVFRDLSQRMRLESKPAHQRALSVADLEALVKKHGSTAAVRDRDFVLWRYAGPYESVDRTGDVESVWQRQTGPEWAVSSPALLKEFGPLREA